MPTTETTKTLHVKRKGIELPYRPFIERMLEGTALSTGTTSVQTPWVPTHDKAIVRLTIDPAVLSTSTTATITVQTGVSTASTNRTVQTSSGALSIAVTTANTIAVRHVFTGLDRFTRVNIEIGGGINPTTGLFIDGEFV